jgi:hypothetical protein
MEDIFDVLIESATDIAACNHNHALVQNPFAWEEDTFDVLIESAAPIAGEDEADEKTPIEGAQENNAK